MNDIDLTEAVETARKVIAERWNMSARNRDVIEDADRIVTRAAPLIAAAVREQVAREIEAAEQAAKRSEIERPVVGPTRTDFANDWQWAARIVRGGAA